MRMVDAEGKIVETEPTPEDFANIYGLGEQPDQGMLPPLEAMMAIEVVKKVLEGNGADGQIMHVAGPDMIRYTKVDEVMQPVLLIARNALSGLGITAPVVIDYVVPCMKTILSSDNFSSHIGANIQSQYDILAARKEEVCFA